MTPRKRKHAAADVPTGEVIQASAHLEAKLWAGPAAEDVRRYLAETGLALEDVLAVLNLENTPDFPHARERLTEEELATVDALGRQLVALERWAWAWRLDSSYGTADAPGEADGLPDAYGLPAEEVLAIRETLAAMPTLPAWDATRPEISRALDAEREATPRRLAEVSPTYRAALERREALDARTRLSPAELRERIAARLTRPDGTVAPSPAQWCAARGANLAAFRQALYVEWFERLDKLRESLDRRRALISPPLRVGSRTATTYARQPGAPWRDTLKRLKTANAISKAELQELEKDEPVPLKGDELLVVAGLLELARREPGFRAFGPTSARVGNYTFETRFLVPKPRIEEFCRLLGYEPTKSGTVTGGDRGKVLRAFEALSTTTRPIVVRRMVRNGKQWEEAFLVARDLPIRDDGEHYALHASLFDGFFHGHLTFHRVPQQWDAARRAIGRRNVTDEMKWGDVYFRRLALGVLAQARREFMARRKAELKAEGMTDRAATRRAVAGWRENRPQTLEKKIRTETLLAELNLTEWREKRGPVATRETLENVLAFARAVEGCPVLAWEWTGTGKLPGKLTVTLETPEAASDPEEEIEQGELFAALAPGDSTPEGAQ